ncbi:hypothetical protein SLS55_008388 [Diplodia seriata]|uniref:Uncharacterized protein n=1 Tax=Diplodia seriata TaxID=420778 RepID=A0ABR3CDL4_9PEZI
MIPSILSAALLALQGASFAVGGVIRARGDMATPTEKQIRERMDKWDNDKNEFVFYVGDMKEPAVDWANERLDIDTITVWDTDKQLRDHTLWVDPNKVQSMWVEQYSKQARGTAWFYWKDAGKVPAGTQSWWIDIEEPILRDRIERHHLEELIQVSHENPEEIYQIMPVDVRDYKGKQCKWHGTAPKCDAKCPDGTKKITESKYGDTPNEKCEGDDRKVFCCKE